MSKPILFERRFDLDWLRFFAVLLLVPFHVAMLFTEWNWHIKNNLLSPGLTYFNGFISMWHMPLFFFISGAGSWFSLRFRDSSQYVRERLLRLFVPLMFGMLVIVPPQLYFERVQKLQFAGSFIKFYPHFFNGVYPHGNLSWHHLWFLAYLFVFSLLVSPLFLYLKSQRNSTFLDNAAKLVEKNYRIYLLSVPLIIIQVLLRPAWPNGVQNLISDWANFLFYITIFVYGYIITSNATYWDSIERNRGLSLVLGICCALVILAINLLRFTPTPGYNFGNMAIVGFEGFNTWVWVLVILGYGKKYLNFTSPLLSYANEASLPFYILHQTVVVTVGFYIIKISASVEVKFTLIMIATVIMTVLIYDLIVRRINILRLLLGMKTMRKKKQLGRAQSIV